MALIDCPECGAEVSDSAVACPLCAFPLTRKVGHHAHVRRGPNASFEVAKQIFSRTVMAGVLLASGIAWEAPPVIVCSLLIGASNIPLLVRARRGTGVVGANDARALEDRIDQRLNEAEDRYQQRLGDIEEQYAKQIIDLDERLEFTERLLTKNRPD